MGDPPEFRPIVSCLNPGSWRHSGLLSTWASDSDGVHTTQVTCHPRPCLGLHLPATTGMSITAREACILREVVKTIKRSTPLHRLCH